MGWTVGGIVGTAAKAKQCLADREALTEIASLLRADVRLVAQAPQSIGFQAFVALLRRDVPTRLTIAEAVRLAKAADATRHALETAAQ